MPHFGNFFEDFFVGQILEHPVERTITEADANLYTALTGSRFSLQASELIAKEAGYPARPLDDILAFHLGFGLSVEDISLNAVANLGYAEVLFHQPLFPGDTIYAKSKVIGVRLNSNKKTGVVYVHSQVFKKPDILCLEWKRWVMVRLKGDGEKYQQPTRIPELEAYTPSSKLRPPAQAVNPTMAIDRGQKTRLEDYQKDMLIDSPFGMQINESDHMLATRLYLNNARVHVDGAFMSKQQPMQKPLVYGGHIISLCRSLGHYGFASAQWLAAIHAGSHAKPCFAGDTIYARHKVLEVEAVDGFPDFGVLRLLLLGYKNDLPQAPNALNLESPLDENCVLRLDYSVFIPR